jgi:hypothetical protein
MGPQMAWTQQWILLWEKQQDPNPIKEFIHDIAVEIEKWMDKGHEMRPGGLNEVIALNGLCNLIPIQHKA